MKNKEMLRKIYYENKAINRNMQRLVNIGLIGILGGIAKEAKASDDPKAKILVKAGMVMIAITEGLLLFSDILDYRQSKIDERKEINEIRIKCIQKNRTAKLKKFVGYLPTTLKRIHILTWFGQKNITTLYESTS